MTQTQNVTLARAEVPPAQKPVSTARVVVAGSVGTIVAGGLPPVLAYLMHATSSSLPVAVMVASALVVTFTAALVTRERADVDLSY